MFDSRVDVSVKFPVISGPPSLPDTYYETENEIKELIWRQSKIMDDIQRERQLLEREKAKFDKKKQEFLKFVADSSEFTHQVIC